MELDAQELGAQESVPETDAIGELCMACFDTHEPFNMVPLADCHHKLCVECAQRLVVEHAPLPHCPMPGCLHIVDESLIGRFTGNSGVSLFREALLEKHLVELSGRVQCLNPFCQNVVVYEELDRRCFSCPCGHPPFCTRCKQPYHFHVDCEAVQPLRKRWLAWLSEGRSEYESERAGMNQFQMERAAALEIAAKRHSELEEDELYKAKFCRLCPHCFTPVMKISGCDSMKCGLDWHGGNHQQGCGRSFNWSVALPYKAAIKVEEIPVIDATAPKLRDMGCYHLFSRCSLCSKMIKGPRFRCIHCEAFDVCESCEPRLSEHGVHPAEHVFEILFVPHDPPIPDIPRNTKVSIFGLDGPGTVLNACVGQVLQYCSLTRRYEIKLPNGSRPIVNQDNVQPEVSDPSEAQAILELALGQQEMRQFYLGLPAATFVQLSSEQSVVKEIDGFAPMLKVLFYDPINDEYGLQWEEPPQWTCTRCTLFNNAGEMRCAACNDTRPKGWDQIRVPTECVQPLALSMEDVKNAAQRHWNEMRRLEAVPVACSLAKGCNLNLPENFTVQLLDASISTQMEYATVRLYTFDGRYKVEIRDLEKSLPASAVVRWVDAKQVRPMFHEEVDPQTAAEDVAQRHIKEESRLQLVWNANDRVEDCCLNLPQATLVHWLSAPQASKYNGCAMVKKYHRDGTYQIRFRDENGLVFSGEIHHVLASELRPVLYKSDDPSGEAGNIMQRHCDEKLRLQRIRAINEVMSGCYLNLPPNTSVEWSGGAHGTNGSKSLVSAKVHGYNMDGTCRIQKRGKNGEFDNEILCVKADELRPVFFQEEDPQRAADGIKKEHNAEQLRLKSVQSINKRMQDCRLGLTPGTFVELIGDSAMTAPTIYNGCAVVRVYNRDATYNVQLRNRDGVCNGKIFCVMADQLQPIVYYDADPEGAASSVAEAHQLEELKLQRLQGIHAQMKHCCLNLSPNQLVVCFSNSSQAYRQAFGLKAAGCGRIKLYNRDGTYQVHLRDAQGAFNQTACVDANDLQPVFYTEEEPEVVAELIAQRHYEEEQRMQSIGRLHSQIECCNLNLPIDTRIVVSAKSDARTCCFEFGSVWTINTGMFEAMDDDCDFGPYYQVKGFCRHCGSSWLDWVPAERISPLLWGDSSLTEIIAQNHSSGMVKIAKRLGRVILDDVYAKYVHVETATNHKRSTHSQTRLEKVIKSSLFANQHTMILGEVQVSNIKTDLRSTYHEAVIQDVACEGGGCQCLVLVNTSDDVALTQQVLQTFTQPGYHFKSIRISDVGIHRLDEPVSFYLCCAEGPYILVGTPAQALDAIKNSMNGWYRELVNAVGSLKWLVVDSVNASPQQLDAFHRCLSTVVARSQRPLKTCINTAMLNPAFDEFSNKTERIILWPPGQNLSLTRVRQYYCAVEREEWKIDTILDILEFVPATHLVVLCRSRRTADYITTEITRRDLPAVAIHDEISFEERNLAVARMRHSRQGALVCADMWGRGFHGGAAWQWGSPVVISYDMPGVSVVDLDTYRNRAGVPDNVPTAELRQSCFINFVTNADMQNMRRVEQHFRTAIEEMPMDVFEQLGFV